MKRTNFNLLLTVSALLGGFYVYLIFQSSNSMRIAAALSALSGFLFIGYARDNKAGFKNMNRVNMTLNSLSQLFELIIITGFLATSMVPQKIGISVLATYAFLKILILESRNNLKTEISEKLGSNYRVYAIVGITALSSLNSHYIYFGSFLLLGIISYDVLIGFYQIYQDRQNIKLKNRILSH